MLYWTFWGMTSLLIGTFCIGGLHTLLWIPRALEIRRARRRHANGTMAPDPAAPCGDPGSAPAAPEGRGDGR